MPSSTKKQQGFMRAELGRKRSGQKTQTGMSENQLSEFASSVKQHGSLEDISYHEEAAQMDVIDDVFVHPSHKASKEPIIWGSLDPPKLDAQSVKQFTPGSQSCNRDTGQGNHYGAPVEYFGPDTDYRAEEIDVHQYGRAYDPYPFRDYYKTDDKMNERTFRVMEQDKYDDTPTPGAVMDSMPHVEAHGAVNYQGAGPDSDHGKAGDCDYRSFESQRKFARTNKSKSQEYAVDTDGLDTHFGKDIQ